MSFVESETISIAFPIFAVKGQKNLNIPKMSII